MQRTHSLPSLPGLLWLGGGSTPLDPVYESNRIVRHLNRVQTIDMLK